MRIAGTCVVTASLTLLMAGPPTRAAGGGPWLSPNRYRTILTVDARGVARSHSPVSVQIDFTQLLAAAGETGTFDPDTVEVIAYDAADAPVVFDAVRNGYDRYLLPWRVERAWPISRVTFSFVMPDHNCTRYELYYDTVESGLGKPQRYPGIVGNGDKFTDGHARREVNACGYDTFCDFDGDGDQDLFKGGTEPYIHVYENVGGNRFVDRGRLTSGGAVLPFPMDGNNRSWLSCEFCDWDRDGDQDLFVHSPTGPDVSYINQVMKYENITAPGGPLTFEYRGLLKTVSGQTLGSAVSFVDWDGDGKTDVMGGRDGLVTFYRNIGSSGSVSNMQIADGVYIRANGVEIQVMSPRTDAKDIDGDGDLDLFVGSEEGRVFFFENVGTRTQPVFTMGRLIAFHEYMDARTGVRVADFDGDGLLDFVPGRYWERTQWGEQPRVYGRLYKNVGTTTAPRFEARDAFNGSPYTERFQNVDAVRQNGVRVVDWDNDGRPDLIASDTDGFVWWFRNTTNRLFPIFAPGVKLMAGGEILRVYGEEDYNRAAGYARCDVCDWNNDGKKDLLVADGRAWLWLYLNENTDASPVLGPGTRVMANGKPIDGTARGSVLVCDWNNDGKKDVIFGMVNNGHPLASQYYDWDHQSADPSTDEGFLFYKNTGSDAAPVLAYPKWLRAGPGGGTIIKYTRPNLGSYVDWDGDGKKDFIGCEFENNARFYKNTGSGAPNTEPAFTSSASGVRIVQPFTVQMMSGADAVDFNGDGDLD
ncbi:MAG: VCBS repeat-containing protein, partial [Planctomycetes bacterium]|nr:VCBS repeat-containing protein [Planctomycetota bacterium]